MKLSAPKQIVWIVAVVLGALGVLSTFVAIPVITGNAFWVVVIAWLLLVLATLLNNL